MEFLIFFGVLSLVILLFALVTGIWPDTGAPRQRIRSHSRAYMGKYNDDRS